MSRMKPEQLKTESIRQMILRSYAAPVANRGLSYAANNRVINIGYLAAERLIHAKVSGSMLDPYLAEVRLNFQGALEETYCTCPVRHYCKHTAALLWTVVAHFSRGGNLSDLHKFSMLQMPGYLAQAARDVKSPDSDSPQSKSQAAPKPGQKGKDLAPGALSVSTGANFKYLVQLLKSDNTFANEVAPRRRQYVYVFSESYHSKLGVELRAVVVKKDGSFGHDKEAEVWDILDPRPGDGDAVPFDSIDRTIVKLWFLAAGGTQGHGLEELLPDVDLLRDLLAKATSTGRAHWLSVHGPKLSMGPDLPGELNFKKLYNDRYQLTPRPCQERELPYDIDPSRIVTFSGNPSVYLDTANSRIGCLIYDHPITSATAEALIALPTVREHELMAVKVLLDDLKAPVAIVRPIVGREAQIQLIKRIPSLHLERRPISDHLRQLRPDLPIALDIALLSFKQPPGFKEGTFTQTIEDRKNDKIVVQKIDTSGERKALDSLVALGFKQILNPESLGLTGQALYLQAPDPTWAKFAAVDRPALIDQGWQISKDKTFVDDVVDTADNQDWSIHCSERGQYWFDLELGVKIDNQQISLIPIIETALANLPEELSLATVDKLAIEGKFYCRMPDGRTLALPFDRVKSVIVLLLELLHFGLHPSMVPMVHVVKLLSDQFVNKLRLEGAAKLRAIAQELATMDGIAPVSAAPGFKAQLRDYQELGLGWLQFIARFGLGGILADEMGLGKTVQALAHIHLQKHQGHTGPYLVICPTSVMPNWLIEAARFTPELKVLGLRGPNRFALYDQIDKQDIIVTTYPVYLRDFPVFSKIHWQGVILDEAQVIKSAKARIKEAVSLLKAEHRICMTGTPIENNLLELWSQFDFVLPGMLGDKTKFTKYFRQPIEKANSLERKQALASWIKPFILRRTKDTVALELPAKTVVIHSVELEGAQRDLYETVRVTMLDHVRQEIQLKGFERCQIVILDALLKLRQTCCDPRLVKLKSARTVTESAKLDALFDLLTPLVDEGRKIILFSQFTSMMDLIIAEMQERQIDFVQIRGDTTDRATPVKRFQNGEVPVFILSLKAGGTGLNLTAADTVILYDPWWNPAVEDQAMDRAHRIGQINPVFVYKLVTRDTIEERIQDLQKKKRALCRAILDNKNDGSASFTQADLELLFKPLETQVLDNNKKKGKKSEDSQAGGREHYR
jgi:hypothetical protein